MKKWIHKLSRKEILGICMAVFCLLVFAGISLAEKLATEGLYDQQMAGRWSEEKDVAQISCFFARDAVEGANYFTGLGMTVEKKLVEASISTETENARLRVDALSIPGKVTISYGSKNVELAALGLQGDFFQFHPLLLLDGSYFGPDSMMQDGIVIDEEAAWQLFGSNDVAGMQVMIGQVPHLISGVIRRDTGRIAEAAGLDRSICYLSLESLQKYGTVTGGYCYEMLMPNPVKGFALSTLSEAVGANTKEVSILENTGRFTSFNLVKKLSEFGTRSMSRQGIVYPYWENMARGYEDILLLSLVIKLLLLIYPVLFFLWRLIRLWRKRTWKAADGYRYVKDKLYDLQVKQHEKKKRLPKQKNVRRQ